MNATPPSSNPPAPGAEPPGGGAAKESQRIWTEAFRAFDALYELPPPQRAAAVDQLRAADLAVADAVQGLLAEHDAQSEPPDGLPQDPEATQRRPDARADALRQGLRTLPRGASEAPGAAAPETIGPWRLLRELGRGGTARVWLARREDVPWLREVALKVPLMGVYRDDLRERLVRERDILSRLEHPHIARLYDAGFAEAQPWLAIEYVQGQDILAWCDARTLGLRERVALFRQVLQAVQYAHAALIVHRDLKPENILVTANGSVRLLDFGIAKLIAEGASHTETTQLTHLAGRMLTPAYASPEQLRDEPLTTATDIYSLGVVLYQLLTGVHPAVGAGARSIQQVERAVTEGRLALASRSGLKPEAAQARGLAVKALKRSLSGDLEAILAKALNLEPAQRYETAAAFDAELEAWLDGRPVRARRPGWLQLTAKLVRRHPWVSGFAVASVVALSTTAVIAVVQAREARTQAEQARVEAARAKASQEFLQGLFDEADPDRNGGKDVLARDLLVRGEQRLERDLARQPLLRAELLASMGKIWWKFGDMDNAARVLRARSEIAASASPGLGHLEALLDEAQAARERSDYGAVRQLLPQIDRVSAAIANVDAKHMARITLERGWNELRARPDAASALPILETSRRHAQEAGAPVQEAAALVAIGWALGQQRQYGPAIDALKRAEELLEGVRALGTGEVAPADVMAVTLERIRILNSAGAYKEGWPLMDRLMSDVAALPGDNRYFLLQFRSWWFGWAVQVGLDRVARTWLESHPDEYAQMVMRDPFGSAERYRWIARMYSGLGEWSAADQALRAGLALDGIEGSNERASLFIAQAESLLMRGEAAQARTALDNLSKDAGDQGLRAGLRIDSLVLSSIWAAQVGNWQQALAYADEAATLADATYGAGHVRTSRARLNRLLLATRASPSAPLSEPDQQLMVDVLARLEAAYPSTARPLRLARALHRALGKRVPAESGFSAIDIRAEALRDLRVFAL